MNLFMVKLKKRPIQATPYYQSPRQLLLQPACVKSNSLWKPESLPPIEIQEGVVNFVNRHVGATVDECVKGLAREFGFRSTGQQLRQIIEKQIEFLVTNEVLTRSGNVLARRPGNIG